MSHMVISINPRMERYQHCSYKVRNAYIKGLTPQAGLWGPVTHGLLFLLQFHGKRPFPKQRYCAPGTTVWSGLYYSF